MAHRYFIYLFFAFILLYMSACENKQAIEELNKEYNIGTISNDELVKLIQGKSKTTRLFVANVAVERGSGAVLKLLNMINYGDAGVKNDIQIAVSGIKDKESIDSLIAFVNRRKWTSFSPILWGIKDFGDQGVEPLIKALQYVKHYERPHIILALGYIDSPKAEQALLAICSNKKDPNWGSAVVALIKRKNETARSLAG